MVHTASETEPDGRSARIACRVRVRGTVQGVGYRPFVYRTALALDVGGWVLNDSEGVAIHAEGADERIHAFVSRLRHAAPPGATIASVDVEPAAPIGFPTFTIRASPQWGPPVTRISADLPTCEACLRELADPDDRRHGYPYINCTDCGPRYSIVTGLPYDRPLTTMAAWAMCETCAQEYADPLDRRFHAQPTACPVCGPTYVLEYAGTTARGTDAIEGAARLLAEGLIVAVKGIGGYHLACDARNAAAVEQLRARKYRKDKPFALMGADVDVIAQIVSLDGDAGALLASKARPIVLAPIRAGRELPIDLISPHNRDLGVMLPYAPLHYLLFSAGAPRLLVMTSANRSSEPIAYRDTDARERLSGLADALLVGERPIARRVEDSIARAGALGPVVLRRARGYAPTAVALLPHEGPLLAAGADLKNTVTLVVDGQAFVSQYVGDLEHLPAFEAFRETIDDLLTMYGVSEEDLLVAYDLHPDYASRRYAESLGARHLGVQHHRAHVASVLAEQGDVDTPAVAAVLDGTGFGDDGTIWGGEIFAGTIADLRRVAHLQPAILPGGDAAARHPAQAAAGFLASLDALPDLAAPPFSMPERFFRSAELVSRNIRCFRTTSAGRLFDVAAALLGFTRPITFEGQAAIWLEHLARSAPPVEAYPFPDLAYDPLLRHVIQDRLRGRPHAQIARAFHLGVARGVWDVLMKARRDLPDAAVVLSGGVFQNELLLGAIVAIRDETDPAIPLWTNQAVPPNDGGISLGQAAIAAKARSEAHFLSGP